MDTKIQEWATLDYIPRSKLGKIRIGRPMGSATGRALPQSRGCRFNVRQDAIRKSSQHSRTFASSKYKNKLNDQSYAVINFNNLDKQFKPSKTEQIKNSRKSCKIIGREAVNTYSTIQQLGHDVTDTGVLNFHVDVILGPIETSK